MTLFEKVKTCVYAASIHRRTKNNTSFKGWANAWLLGVDRSVSGSESVANGHRSAGSLSAKSANCYGLAAQEEIPERKRAHEVAANRWTEEVFALLGYSEEGVTALLEEAKVYPDDTNNFDAPSGYRGYVNKIPKYLTQEQWDAKMDEQNHACAICRKPASLCLKYSWIDRKKSPGLVRDHDHVNGRIRGLLCTQCNLGLGNFKESIPTILRAMEYLQKYSLTSE